jgi:hypothetical protein
VSARAGRSRARRAGARPWRGSPCTRALGLGLWLLLAPVASPADLLHCVGPDGRKIFTDDASVCPGATPYEPSGRVHSVDPVDPAVAARESRLEAVERRRLADQAAAGEAQRWQQRKRDKQDELAQLARQRATLLDLIAWCNHGGRVVAYDDAGIQQAAQCSDVQKDLEALDKQAASLRDYLEHSLPEECRRAGCLPGWLR